MEAKELINATCPECRGPVTEVRHDGQMAEFECLVGHRYSAAALLKAHSETQERALWAAVVALEEARKLVEAVASELPPACVERLRAQAEGKQTQAREVKEILQRLEPFQLE